MTDASEASRRLVEAASSHVVAATEGCSFERAERRFGVELEFSIVDDAFLPVLGSAEPIWRQRGALAVAQELGSFQIEVNPPPEPLDDGAFHRLHDTLRTSVGTLQALCAAGGSRLLPIGLAPCVPPTLLEHPDFFASNERFRASAAYSRRHRQEARVRARHGPPATLPHGSAVALINELHVHIEALSADEIGPLFEAAQDLTPLLAALGANSGWFNGTRLAYLEHQVGLFAESEARPAAPGGAERVGLYPHRFSTPLDYFDWIARFPLWAPVDDYRPSTVYHAFEKNYCGWVRLRLEGPPRPSLRIELRVPSVQPTLRENLALAEWAVGAVVARAHGGAAAQPAAQRRANLERCTRAGLDARVLWGDGARTRELPVTTAIEHTLADLGSGTFLPLLQARLARRMVPALQLAEACARQGTQRALQTYYQHFLRDEPYVA